MGEAGALLFVLVFEFFGPIIVIGLLIWGAVVFFRGRRLKKSLNAVKDDAQATALEKLRIKASVIGGLSFLALIAGFAIGITLDWGFSGALMAGVSAQAIMGLWAFSLRQRYNKEFKDRFVKAELAKAFGNLEYDPNGVFDAEALKELKFFVPFASMRGSDLITAEYKGIRFTQSDISLMDVTITHDKDGKTQENFTTFFNGRAMRFDFAQAFKGEVQVVRRNFGQARVTEKRGDWQELETELAEFRDDYRVFSPDPVAALTILTPQMIEGVYYLDKALRVPLALHFSGNSMFVFMALARDAFEASEKKTLLENRRLLEKDIALITGFLDTMYFKERGATPPAAAESPAGDGAAAGMETGAAAGAAAMAGAGAMAAGAAAMAAQATAGAAAMAAGATAEMAVSLKKTPGEQALSNARNSVQRLGYTLSPLVKLLGVIVCYGPVLLYVASAVYTLWALPDGICLSISYSNGHTELKDSVPTLGYIIVASIFIVPMTAAVGKPLQTVFVTLVEGGNSGIALGKRIKTLFASLIGAALFLIPFGIHLSFLSANLSR